MYGHATVNEFPRAYSPKLRGVRRVRTRFRRRGDHLPDHICVAPRWAFVVSAAMAKTESTAVNSLIDLVQSNQAKPIIDPDDDLFAAPKQPAKQPPLPSLRGGTVPPLPRSRAPGGTSQLTLPEHRAAVLEAAEAAGASVAFAGVAEGNGEGNGV